jgi:hypothetical protein
MSTPIERNILTVLEPEIMLDPLDMPDAESGTENMETEGALKTPPSKFTGGMLPIIRIKQYEVQADRLTAFNLNLTGFIPTMRVSFEDVDTTFMARHYPTDGDVMQLNIRSQGDETTFKPIRIDFTITNCYPLGGGGNVSANKFVVEGIMLVPNLFNELVKSYPEATSFDTLLDVAEELKLGFAANVDSTADAMTWINPNDTVDKFIQDVAANAYLSDEHFFKAYIDPYYYLTLVDCNVLFNQEGALEASQTFSQNMGDVIGDTEGQQADFPNYLSNLAQMQGGARYLSKYQMVNNSGEIANDNGYKRFAQWYDLGDRVFLSEFVDPITDDNPGMINMKGRTVGPVGEKVPEGIADTQNRYKYLGKQSDNEHENYMYSIVQNYQNNQEVEKMGMTVELDTINPALLRYTRIYCYIVEYASAAGDAATAEEDGEQEPQPDAANRDNLPENSEDAEYTINNFLTGFYVISGIEYIQRPPGPLRMRLHLQRREYYPST